MNEINEEVIEILQEILHALENDNGAWLEMFLSAFLGFGFALLVEALVSIIGTRNTVTQLKKALIGELEQIANTLQKIKDDEYYFYPYKLPIWSGACKSGAILTLNNIKEFTKLLDIFASIEEANVIEKEGLIIHYQSNNTTSRNRDKHIKEAVLESRKKLATQVEKGKQILSR
ncbi:MAG: hypothetical protein IJY88_08245 [Clostridia bacterium]|nr:hypothetical protein [Clostridia bacterium]